MKNKFALRDFLPLITNHDNHDTQSSNKEISYEKDETQK
jgi:hypothetical protein